MNTNTSEFFIPEIFELISNNLNQFDLISLLKSCTSFYSLSIPILYKSITIDCNFSQFEKEYLFKSTTFIRNKSNFLSLIKSLNNNINKYNKNYWIFIKNLNVINLPLEFYDFESILIGLYDDNNLPFFEKSRLNCLNIDSPISFNILKYLLNDKYSRENLTILNLNINKHLSLKPFKEIIDNTFLNFQNLNTLSIKPINQDIKFNELLKLIDLDNNFKLKNLKLESTHKTCKLYDLLEFSDDIKLHSCNYLFNYLNDYENLKSLSLNSININQNLLIKNNNINNFNFFKNLIYLELSDIGIISSNSNESLLHTFYKNFNECNLKIIKLDLRSTVDDLIPNFFDEFINLNQIKELDLTIRYNNMHEISLTDLINKYLNLVILKQKDSIEKLSIEISSERNLINLDEQLEKDHLLKLISNKFKSLKSLRIQVQFDYILLYKNLLFKNLSNLENLWIVGSSAVPMHFGLGNMYPGIFDQWWRIIYLPKSLIDGIEIKKIPLHYIKIDECLFVIEHEKLDIIQPKNQIDKIFDQMTRVSFDNILIND